MPTLFDVIIIGSGPAGTHAAKPLVNAGLSVCILDGGEESPRILSAGEPRMFEDVRTYDPAQGALFLGEDYSGIPMAGNTSGIGGGMTSGNRSYVTRGTAEHLPLTVKNGHLIQSLAMGGLGAAWGGACAYMRSTDLEAMGLPPKEMEEAYDIVTQDIGISGPQTRQHIQPSLPHDDHASTILLNAQKKEKNLQEMHVRFVEPHMAALTKDHGERKAHRGTDMDYYHDPQRSLYRPQYTLEELRAQQNFQYIGGIIVRRIETTSEGVVVFGHAMGDTMTRRWTAKRVIVAAGAINTARILLASTETYGVNIPIVIKPHVLIACIDKHSLGKKGPRLRSSLCQLLSMCDTPVEHELQSACAQLYSYRSLLLFRLLPKLPLPAPQALALLSLFTPSLVIADTRFPALQKENQTLTLQRRSDGRDEVCIHCNAEQTPQELHALKTIKRALRTTGLLPIRTIHTPTGSTSHYAGTVPVTDNGGGDSLSCDRDGRVYQMKNVFVADASMFRVLPAVPHTLTIMANAQRIGKVVHQELMHR